MPVDQTFQKSSDNSAIWGPVCREGKPVCEICVYSYTDELLAFHD